MTQQTLTIATRESALALWQAYHIQSRIGELFPDIDVRINKMTSKGDQITDRPLALIGGKGHFTKELEEAMFHGEADMAVHSLKDVPTYIPDGLELSAITSRQDQSDVFLSHKYMSLADLPEGAIVGTTSLRRRMQVSQQRDDVVLRDLRGNVNTRLRKLSEGQYDAIILAYIGLHRLDLLKDIPHVEKLDFMIPPMGQAALGIEIIADNPLAREVSEALNDPDTFLCTRIERDFVAAIGAGCSAPVAVNATIEDDHVHVQTMLGFPDGTHILQAELSAPRAEANDLGKQLSRIVIEQGAKELLAEAEKVAFKDEMPERL